MRKTIAHSATGIVGVQGPYQRVRMRQRRTGIFSSVEVYFQATWQEDGAKRKQYFSINAYGFDRALELAIEARAKGLNVVGPPR